MNNLILIKIRFLTLKDSWLFLLGIIFVSMTSGAIGSFILGVNEEEFFIGGAEDILIITEPGLTTPITGQVPEALKFDIEKIDGVKVISPEALAFTVAQNLNDRSILIRGISPEFSKLSPIRVTDGSWFSSDFGGSKEEVVNGAMIGYLLAKEVGIECGDKLQLASTLTDIMLEIVITGIISSDSPSDEEILVNLEIGKSFIGKGISYVSFLRVLIDVEKITKNELFGIINANYTLTMKLIADDPDFFERRPYVPVIVYTSYGAYVARKYANNDNVVDFNLKFGSYEFIAFPENDRASSPMEIFLNRNYSDPIDFKVGGSYFDLGINVSFNQKQVENALVTLKDRFEPSIQTSLQSNSSGLALFENVHEGHYTLITEYFGLSNSTNIQINSSCIIDVKIENFVTINVFNTTSGKVINGGTIEFLPLNLLITDYISGKPIFVDPGSYMLNYSVNGLSRVSNTEVKGPTNISIFLGHSNLTIHTLDDQGADFSSVNVSIFLDDQIIEQDQSNIEGICHFYLESGLNYIINFISPLNPIRILNETLFLNSSQICNYEILDDYKLNFLVFNGTISSPSLSGFPNSEITLLKNSSIILTGDTNINGWFNTSIFYPGYYYLIVNYLDFNYQGKIYFPFKKINDIEIPLGNVYYSVLAKAINGYPINNAIISIENDTSIITTGITNSTGYIDLIFPPGEYTIHLRKENIVVKGNVTINISGRFRRELEVESNSNLKIIVNNQYSQKVAKANIKLVNSFYNVQYIGFTDINGEFIYFNLPWGTYSASISYQNQIFPTQPLEIACSDLEHIIFIETASPIADFSEYSIQGESQFSVIISTSYVTGFIESTLAIIVTTLISLIVIISVLSLLSIASVISHPIVSNEKTLHTLYLLGATREQLTFTVVTQLVFLGIFSSAIGSFLGMIVMVSLPTLKAVNVGGIIINPVINPVI
ncbi:MAG: ABC transporter permease, partial [Candidatus Lokiarchaeota archaeon]|nr:ABC transporter permease [Candidatus Lokiarchaeota archaeon]